MVILKHNFTMRKQKRKGYTVYMGFRIFKEILHVSFNCKAEYVDLKIMITASLIYTTRSQYSSALTTRDHL